MTRSSLDLVVLLVVGLQLVARPASTANDASGGNIDDIIKEVFGDGSTRGSERPSIITTTFRPSPGREIPVYEPNTDNPNRPVDPDPSEPDVLTGGGGGGNRNTNNNNNNNEDNGLGGTDCTCVPYYLCTSNNTVITDGSGLLDIRAKGGNCDNYMDVCCGAPSIVKEPVTPKPHGRLGCGKRNSDGVGFRITGNVDNESQFGEFPWMIAVLKQEKNSDKNLNVYQCGGALIHESVIVTAAHCVVGKEPGQLKVRAGEWDTQTKTEIYPHQDRSVQQIIVHERYHAGGLHNDVALLIVSEPFKFDENVDIVCLPRQNDVILSQNCFASGWGKDVFGSEPTQETPKASPPKSLLLGAISGAIDKKVEKIKTIKSRLLTRLGVVTSTTENPVTSSGKEGHYQVILKKVELPMVPRDTCQTSLRQTRLGQYFKLHESFVCAGGEPGKDTCKGDGGSPLVCPIPGKDYKYQHVGIVAWGIGCGNTTPAVYVNVAHFRQWIDNHMKKFNFRIDYDYDSN